MVLLKHANLLYRVESQSKVSQFNIFLHLTFIFCGPGQNHIYIMYNDSRFKVS
jgi:hypothetical protein